jgi:hypothetical protein
MSASLGTVAACHAVFEVGCGQAWSDTSGLAASCDPQSIPARLESLSIDLETWSCVTERFRYACVAATS